MILVEVALEEQDGKQRRKQHLSATHHLVYAGGDAEQAHIHEDGRDEVKGAGDGQQQRLLQAALVDDVVALRVLGVVQSCNKYNTGCVTSRTK